ncbi:DNA polymerase zeta subunit [Wickerhamomyces ciferrii]|uniref:DNA polymerase n=1 Tax=Wickerhamomyces ciferrii (strain ATCC 14091 / BCRC 22168 / CBS 111 / JCM 3599 / NBRC 0793 / NRRL Y-1031 F-60-10) TaxID=1206466 RepID=K0K6B9_WICCF|nr:DNA polymerase zeta subunit [Wickerhamomyces ciferrii]CCH40490.1 DNA polymerase zeta subunit [Wickerhamomyces ciferrii]
MQRRNRDDFYATKSDSFVEDDFKIQINTYDHYQVTPSIFDRDGPINKEQEFSFHHVPVVRVFGSIPTGHNIIAHIHGAYPYIYIPYDNQDCFRLQQVLEAAIASSLNRKKSDNENTNDNHKESKVFKYIAHISLCKGVPFYGYNVGYKAFYKIYLLNPSYSNRLAEMLRDGKATGKKYDCYEVHIPYVLQFLSDFNLFGCAWLRLKNLYLRSPILSDDSLKTDELVEYLTGFQPTDAERTGYSALEIDVCAQDILNRLDLKERELHHDFIEKFNPPSSDIYIQSTKDLWKDGDFQRKAKGEVEYSTPQSTLRSPNVEWVETEELNQLFEYAKKINGETTADFSNFIKKGSWENDLKSSFQTVSEMFHEPDLYTDHEKTIQSEHSGEEDEYDPNDFLLDDYQGPAVMNRDDDLEIFENARDDDERNAVPGIYEPEDPNDFEGSDEFFLSESQEKLQNAPDISDIHLTQNMNVKFTQNNDLSRVLSSLDSSTKVKNKFPKLAESRFIYSKAPPLDLDFGAVGLPQIDYNDPFYTEEKPKPFVFGGKKFNLKSKAPKDLDGLEVHGESISKEIEKGFVLQENTFKSWRYIKKPPSFNQVKNFVYGSQIKSQIGVTQRHKFASPQTNERRPDGSNHMTVLIVEVHSNTRESLRPDPKYDEVSAIFWKTMNGSTHREGVYLLNVKQPVPDKEVTHFISELEMFESFTTFVRKFDPDIISGFEVQSGSWGYLIERARAIYEFDFVPELSRVHFKAHNKMGDHWGYTHTSSIKVCGRQVLNIWRPLRRLNLLKYTIENVAYHALHERLPHYSNKTLTKMFQDDFLSLSSHYFKKLEIDGRLIDTQELITRAAEEARLIGIDFNDVYYRGSQYKVESFMVRMAKAENFMLFSPSKRQVRKQKPLECIPLVMEPISAYYKSPLIVLDFQSLYPSIVIAYNYCYSTLLGRLRNYSNGPNHIGTSHVKHPPGLLKLLENDINISPNGLMFAKSSVRKSLLAKMLEEILDTRFMVKSTMKFLDENMKQLYNSRQLALKLIANVTYGYTSASFSGRMPCSDIADAIVQTGRETLDKAVDIIEGQSSWGAKVVYGDTDSLFVYLPGRSRDDAFRIGKEMADAVTKSNPDPVTLKFEKVYHPCVLMAKKRYVGYSYENINSPVKFDAKGIETVRRDGHPAQQHIVEKCLRILFETNDISQIKNFVQDQFNKITYNKVSIQDFCFAKEVKIGTYKQPPPGAVVSTKLMEQDSRAEPQYKERVPYVIIQETGSILRERARTPEQFIENNYKLDAEYYIVKTLIPPLERIFNLLGVDVKPWYNELPRPAKRSSIYNSICLSCNVPTKSNLCQSCRNDELKTVLNLNQRMKQIEGRMKDLMTVCRSCSGHSVSCESHDCPVYYTRVKEGKKLEAAVQDRKRLKKEIDW